MSVTMRESRPGSLANVSQRSQPREQSLVRSRAMFAFSNLTQEIRNPFVSQAIEIIESQVLARAREERHEAENDEGFSRPTLRQARSASRRGCRGPSRLRLQALRSMLGLSP